MYGDPTDPMAVAPPSHASGIVPDSGNPAARAFALMRIRQFFRSGLGGGMNPGQIGDPTAYWRQLSQGLGADPQRLAQFQGAAHAPALAPTEPGGDYLVPVGQAVSAASPRAQLNAMAAAKAVARTMSHLRQLRPVPHDATGYRGPH